MKKIFKRMSAVFMLCFIFIFSNCISIFAASSPLNSSEQKSFVFAVPEGGWSTAVVKATYYEYYKTKNSNNTFYERAKSMVGKRNYATVCPIISLDLVSHSNGTNFTSWKSESVIYGTEWDCGASLRNTDSVTYSTTTSTTGSLTYSVQCDGALVPYQASKITLSLKTK